MLFDTVPVTVTCLFGPSTTLSTARNSTVPVLAVSPAAIVSVLFALSVKSAESAFVPGAALTVTVVAAPDLSLRSARTVVYVNPVPPSRTVERPTAKLTVGAASSSVIVPVPVPVAIVAFVGELNSTTTVSLGSSRPSPFTVTAKLFSVSPAANVKVVSEKVA